jgi:hypothetical protein
MGRAKIVLDTTCKFPRGSHERIWYGMAEGAALLADHSHFVARDFRDGHEILCLPRKPIGRGELDHLRGLIEEPRRLQRIAEAAAPIYAAKHRWKERARLIDAAINGAPQARAARS